MIGRRETAGAGHVLHDDLGMARQVLAHAGRDQPRIEVVAGAGRIADHDGERLRLEELLERLRLRAA
jgi:hypothetical protein